MNPRRLARITLSIAAAGVLFGCEPTTRVISVRGGLQNIEGAEGGIRPDGDPGRVGGGGSIGSLAMQLYGPLPGEPVEGNQLRRELEDGEILLVSRSPAELFIQLRQTIRNEEWDLLYDQLLSTQLKEAYEERGLPPESAIEYIKRYAQEINEVLRMMPIADQTPGASFRSIGRNTYRITIPGGRMVESTFRSMDVVYEDRQFRLRMLN